VLCKYDVISTLSSFRYYYKSWYRRFMESSVNNLSVTVQH